MADILYTEARGEPFEGKVAVAKVVINRIESKDFPDTVCAVIYDPGQFAKPPKRKNRKEWIRLYQLSEAIIKYNDMIYDPSNGALYFHATHVKPKWGKRSKRTTIINKHMFYK